MTLSDIDISRFDTILLDRDGVINRLLPNDYVKEWSEFEFLPDVKKTLAEWACRVRHIFVVTNQRGVGRGLMTEKQLEKIHKQMCEEIAAAGGRIDGIYYCTATTNEAPRRKPNRGMFDDILRDFPDIQVDRTLMIGDSESDMRFAENCGIKGIMVSY